MSQGGALSSTGSGGPPIETLTGNSGGPVGPDAAFNIDIVGNNATGIDIVGTPAMNLLTVMGIQASDIQIGVTELATNAEAITGISTILATTPANLLAVFASPFPIGSTTPNTGDFSDLDVDNININGNTISSTNANGDILLDPNGTGAVVVPASNNLYVGSATPSNPYNIAIEDSVSGLIGESIQNTSNNAAAGSNLQIIVEPATADAFTLYSVNGANTWSTGIDNSDSDAYKITTGSTPSAGSVVVRMSTAGEINYPLQPAFFAVVGTTVTNVTGDGTVYTVIFNTEIYDQNADYNNATGTFTAPVTGRYHFNFGFQIGDIAAGHTNGNATLTASNRTLRIMLIDPSVVAVGGFYSYASGSYIDMDAADTITATIQVSGGALVIDVLGTSAPTEFTYFGGKLVC